MHVDNAYRKGSIFCTNYVPRYYQSQRPILLFYIINIYDRKYSFKDALTAH